jgi:uncharacterized MAPEG superfamily protein
MRIELICLVINALWGFGLVSLEINAKTRIAGLAWNLGNRAANPAEFPDWIDRVGRALANHKENFPLFLTSVVVAVLTGHVNQVTAIAAIVYVIARALHGIVYIAGITGLRTAVWIVGSLSTLTIFSQLLF